MGPKYDTTQPKYITLRLLDEKDWMIVNVTSYKELRDFVEKQFGKKKFLFNCRR
jgi:hypothetical protein